MRPVSRPVAKSGLGSLIILIILVPYAVIMTAVAAHLYFKINQIPHPLEAIPDNFGDTPGATRKPGKVSIRYEHISPDTPLPDKLKVPLHQSLTVGDLQVEPQKVERSHIFYCYEHANFQKEPSREEALVLTLKLRNVSTDDYFVPTDPAFYLEWTPGNPEATRPFTFVQVGDKRFYGGPVAWPQLEDQNGKDPREYVQGQENYHDVLKPGETREVKVFTDPKQTELLRAVSQATGPLIWRVQLRRGLVRVPSTGREVPATAVVGVQFGPREIQ